jgi:hypothetical protein
MQILSEIMISRPQQDNAIIQLLQGDLAAIPKEHAADILIISAYPGSYMPVPRTLIAALVNKGLSVEQLAKSKAIDLRDQLGCWLSQPLTAAQQEQFNFKKILCFEPWQQTTDQTAVIGNIFRCINTFAFNENNNVIAMPVLASGKQKVPFEKMLPALLDASIFWMESGLPLKAIKLVLYSDEQAKMASPIFYRAKQQNELKQLLRNKSISGSDALEMLAIKKQEQLPGEETMQMLTSEIQELADKEKEMEIGGLLPERGTGGDTKTFAGIAPAAGEPPRNRPATAAAAPSADSAPIKENPAATVNPAETTVQYDYFVSYAHKHADVVDIFVNNMKDTNKNLQLFYDKSSIPCGGLWIKQISDAIQKAKKVLVFLSPEYSNSPVCWDEFQCAKLVEYNSKKPVIQTIYLYNDTAMPPIMGIYSWADCREGDTRKLQQIAVELCAPVN